MENRRPKFLPSYLGLLKKEAEGGWHTIVPAVLILASSFGLLVALVVPDDFWASPRWDISTAVYSGVLTFNGLMLVLGWTAFSRMYEVIFRGEFGAYLAKSDLLNDYLVHINYMHIVHLLAVTASGAGLILVLVDWVPLWADRAALGITFTMTVYSVKQATNAVTAMNDLAWQAAFFELHRKQSNDGGNNVKPFGPRAGG